MKGLSERLQIVRGAEVRVDIVQILLPVAVVGLAVSRLALDVLGDRRDPDSVEAHALNIVQSVNDASPGAAAVLPATGITCCGRAAVRSGEAISEELVDAAASPFFGTSSESGR